MASLISIIMSFICALIIGVLVGMGINWYLGGAAALYIFCQVAVYLESK